MLDWLFIVPPPHSPLDDREMPKREVDEEGNRLGWVQKKNPPEVTSLSKRENLKNVFGRANAEIKKQGRER